jgi:hypothetical protein
MSCQTMFPKICGYYLSAPIITLGASTSHWPLTTLYVLKNQLCFFLPSLTFLGLPSGHFPAQHPRTFFTTSSSYMPNTSSTHKFYYCFTNNTGCLKQRRQHVSTRKETRNFVLESAWKERQNFIIISGKHKKKGCWIDDRLFPFI